MWEPSLRYPDPNFRILDASFSKYRLNLASVERLYTGCRWSEGPVWFGDGRFVLWSDIPNNRILRWDEASGAVSVFRHPSHNANGNTRDRQGRLVTCEHDARRVTRTEYDGAITVLAERFEGKRLNSPNDVVVASDGGIWFTDPTYGIVHFYEGHPDVSETAPAVYRIDPGSGAVAKVADGFAGPNGLAFSPDEKTLYVVDSRHEPQRQLLAFDVVDGVRLARQRLFIDAGPGAAPDGIRCDVDGNLWCGWGTADGALDGVRVFNGAGVPIGQIVLPERAANLCFGGRHRNRLFMAAAHSLYALYVGTQGAAGG
jgi:gluconolactonase